MSIRKTKSNGGTLLAMCVAGAKIKQEAILTSEYIFQHLKPEYLPRGKL